MTPLTASRNTAQPSHKDLTRQATATPSSMLNGWTDAETQKFQSEIMTFQHRLEETGLLSDEALINLEASKNTVFVDG